MFQKCNLYQISNRLNCGKISLLNDVEEIKKIENSFFGNCHVIFGGDMYQLPPCGGDEIYNNNCNNKHSKIGLDIFNSINEYSDLKINHRLKKMLINDINNKEYQENIAFEIALQNARLGKVTDDDINLFNTRLGLTEEQCFTNSHINAIILSAHNIDVNKYNEKKIKFIKNNCKNNINYICYAHHFPTSNRTLTTAQYHNSISIKGPIHCPPGKIDLVIGGRYRITDNIASPIGLSNGTLGTIIGIGFDNNYDIEKLNISNFYDEIDINKRPIPIVFFQLDIDKYKIGLNCINNFENIIVLKPKEFNLISSRKRYQLPLTPAFASTVHKVQGITSKYGIILNPTDNSKDFSNYVAVSRTKELKDLTLLKPVSKGCFNDTDTNSKKRIKITELYSELASKFENQLKNLYLYNDFLNDLIDNNLIV